MNEAKRELEEAMERYEAAAAKFPLGHPARLVAGRRMKAAAAVVYNIKL